MKLSIVVPYYNRSNTIQRCLKSIGKHADVEIIVVDDFSNIEYTDQGYSEKIIRLPFNQGPVAARIVGAENSSGSWILFLDSDDELIDNWRSLAYFLINNTDYTIQGYTSIGEIPREDFYINSQDEYWKWVGDKNRSADYILFVRRDLIATLNLPKLRMSEVWMINKLFNIGKGIYHKTPIFIYHQDSGNQLSKKQKVYLFGDKFERESINFVVSEFIALYNKLPNRFKRAWAKRLIKETVLSMNVFALGRLVYKVLKK